jgi:hypothetical protein
VPLTSSAPLSSYGITETAIRAIAIRPASSPPKRERVELRNQHDPKALAGAVVPGALPEEGKRLGGKVNIVHVARPDTDKHISRRGKLQKVAVNANCDALEREAREGRIGVDAYWAGFTLQALLERSHGLLAPPNREFLAPMGGNKVAGQAHAMMKRMEKAKFMTEQFRAIQAIVGMTGMRILTLCLIGKLDGKGPCTFSEVAESLGMGVGSYGANDDGAASKRLKNEGIKVGWAFRNSLDLLASHWEYGSAPALPKYGWR